MSLRKLIPILVLLGVVIGITTWAGGRHQRPPAQPRDVWVVTTEPADQAALPISEQAAVLRVVDGDTLKVRTSAGTERVRIIGINTPELDHNGGADECYAREATNELEELIGTRGIELRADPSQGDRDKYGRLLRHVTVDGASVALALIAGGAGHEYTYDKPYAGQAEYRNAEASARNRASGLWGRCH